MQYLVQRLLARFLVGHAPSPLCSMTHYVAIAELAPHFPQGGFHFTLPAAVPFLRLDLIAVGGLSKGAERQIVDHHHDRAQVIGQPCLSVRERPS